MTACGPPAPDTGRIRDALPSSKDDFAEDREAACGWSSAMPRVGNITRFSGGAEMVTPVLCDVRGGNRRNATLTRL